MQTSPYEIALIAGGFTIIGALIGGWIGYRNALRLHNITEFNKAAADFRNAFLPLTTFLKYNANIGGLGSSNNLREILRTGYLCHLKALEIFKSYLSATDRAAINNAWDEYCHPKGIPQNPNEKRDFRFDGYMGIEESEGADKAKEVALQKIYKILKVADFK
ncbi:hypothetical protein KA005_71430 [bacterium]|nr:hypothetical protein [bacterium]